MRSLTLTSAFILWAGIPLLQVGGEASVKPSLTFEQRVEAQRAIERVRYNHQVGARRPFDEAVSAPVLERQVHASMDTSLSITPEMLRDEAARISRATRMPDRLRELYAALGNDPMLIQESLVRPALVGRLLRERVSGVSVDDATAASSEALSGPGDVWDNQSLDQDNPGPWAGGQHVAVWTGNLMLVWLASAGTGGRYDPVLDSWSPISTIDAPGTDSTPAAVWSGQEMLIWGAQSRSGGRYDPLTDSWSPMTSTGAPSHRYGAASVWAGDRLIIYGGWDLDKPLNCCVLGYCAGCGNEVNTGGMYDPATESWSSMATANAPPAQYSKAVWTGSRMIVFGGYITYIYYRPGPYKPVIRGYGGGGIFDPVANQWSALPAGPGGRDSHVAAWTGSRMLIWGGSALTYYPPTNQFTTTFYDTGAAYDPVSNTWSPISRPATPLNCCTSSAVWTGSGLIVWGGSFLNYKNDGGVYDPVLNSWSPTSLIGAPAPRVGASAIWDGSEMIVWSGTDGSYLSTGGRYMPPDLSGCADADQDGFTRCDGDCNDSNPAIHPGATEVCDGLDDDCNGALPANETDADRDGYMTCNGECNDSNPAVHPGATEICDGLDDDCDGALSAAEIDADGDGYTGCTGDCDETNPAVNPGGVDLPGNILDENCDGSRVCDPYGIYASHGIFIKCVFNACVSLTNSGAVTQQQCQDAIRDAVRSDVGKHSRKSAPTPAEP